MAVCGRLNEWVTVHTVTPVSDDVDTEAEEQALGRALLGETLTTS